MTLTDIQLIDSIGKINLTTSSGNVLISNKTISENMRISTSSGDVDIDLPKDSSYTISGSTLSGKFTSQVPMLIEQNHKGIFQAKIGSGEKHIDITTSSGSVNFKEQ